MVMQRIEKLNFNVMMKSGFVILSFLMLTACTNGNQLDFQTMLQNMSQSFPAVWKMVTALAYVLGFIFAFRAVFSLKAFGEARLMSASTGDIKKPLVYLLVSAALIFLPTTFQSLLQTSFGYIHPTPLSYDQSSIGNWTYASTLALLGLVQLVGVIAFVRGWLYIAKAGEGASHQNAFGKGVTHIIGGILAVNIVGTKDVIWNTFGFGS